MEEKNTLCRSLRQVDTSLVFLVLILFSVLLSYWSVGIQRDQLCRTIQGKDVSGFPSVYPIKHAAAAIVVGSLSFFLCLALSADRQAQAGSDPAACRSARVNLWASILVLAAALLRLDDLTFVERSRQSALLEEDTLPD